MRRPVPKDSIDKQLEDHERIRKLELRPTGGGGAVQTWTVKYPGTGGDIDTELSWGDDGWPLPKVHLEGGRVFLTGAVDFYPDETASPRHIFTLPSGCLPVEEQNFICHNIVGHGTTSSFIPFHVVVGEALGGEPGMVYLNTRHEGGTDGYHDILTSPGFHLMLDGITFRV